jgi:hypothetical protein
MQETVRRGGALTLRPRFARIAGRAYAAGALAVVPPFAALYWLIDDSDRLGGVPVANAAVAAVIFVGISLARLPSVTFTSDGVRERGYFGGVTFTPRDELVSVLVVQVNDGRSLQSQTNLFFLDASGSTRLRVRGQFWSDEAIAAAVDEYELPTERLAEPVARAELRHRYRDKLYLHERHPLVTYAIFALVLLGIGTPLVLLMTAATA